MPRRFEHRQSHLPEIEAAAVGHRHEGIFGLRPGTQIDAGSRTVSQLEMSGHEVCVKVGQKHVTNLQSIARGVADIALDVALRIDDSGCSTSAVADQVRCVRETIEVILLQNHQRPFNHA